MGKKQNKDRAPKARSMQSVGGLAGLGAAFGLEPEVPIKQNNSDQQKVTRRYNNHDHFINPYNFVPLGKKCTRGEPQKGRLTGKITCTLTPKTDFFVPNTSNDTCSFNGRPGTIREFASYEQLDEDYPMTGKNAPEHPIIPGSELRGMVRSMYETFTNSCMSIMDDDLRLSSRTPMPRQAGLVVYKNEEWQLYKAEAYHITYRNSPYSCEKGVVDNHYGTRCGTGDLVNFSWRQGPSYKLVTEIGEGQSSGYVKTGLAFFDQKQHRVMEHAHIFTPVEQITIPSEELLTLIKEHNDIITEYYQNEKVNNFGRNQAPRNEGKTLGVHQRSYINTNNPDSEKYYPVWYDERNGQYYLSPAQIGRNIYHSKLRDFILDYQACTDKNNLCPACSLFGFVGSKSAAGSRLRFTDAVFTGMVPQYSPIATLQELSTPSINSMEMYTRLSNCDDGGSGKFWTYDYIYDGEKTEPVKLLLNGRKFYYHHKSDYSDQANNRSVTVRPMQGTEENQFSFDVYFEHLTDDELKQLLAVLSLMGNDSSHCYKLGMGKPLGLGSVKVKVDKVWLRKIRGDTLEYSFEATDGYSDYYTGNRSTNPPVLGKAPGFKQLMDMTNLDYVEQDGLKELPVCYPRPYPDERKNNIFDWFSNNRHGIISWYEQILPSNGVLKRNGQYRVRIK